jgi:predicted alpha/beta hydrolase family esterase
VPGNGCDDVKDANWYYWAQLELQKQNLFSEVVLESMPDPMEAKESIWLEFMKTELKCDATTIGIGHSSGAEAFMRYAENNKLAGMILVSACYTDLGVESERKAGYYNRPWQWEKIK